MRRVSGRPAWDLGAALALLLIALLVGCGGGGAGEARGADVFRATVEPGEFLIAVPAEGELRAVNITPIAAPDVPLGGLTITRLLDQGSRVREGDVVVEFDPSAAERMARDEEADHKEVLVRKEKAGTTSTREAKGLEAAESQAGVELEEAETTLRAKDPRLTSGHERIEAELQKDLAEIHLDVNRTKRDTQEAASQADLEILAIEEEKTMKELELAEKAVRSMVIRAPQDGIVLYRNRWGGTVSVGDSVWPNDTIGEIPDQSELEVKAHLLELDAGAVVEGLEARVHIDSLPGRVLPARVKSVAKVASTRDRGSPVKYFEVILSLEQQNPEVLRIGMKATVEIVVEQLEDVLTLPRYAIHEDRGKMFVYAMKDGTPRRCAVQIGMGTREQAVITKGLSAGDVVLLRDLATEIGEPSRSEKGNRTGRRP